MWTNVGGLKLDIEINKGGGFTVANATFYATPPSGGHYTQTLDLTQLTDTFGRGATVQLFEKWYFEVTNAPRFGSGKLYRSDNTLAGWGSTNEGLTRTDFSFIVSGSGETAQVAHWHYNWGDDWKGSEPAVSGECVWATLALYVALGNLHCDCLELMKVPEAGPGEAALLSKDMAQVVVTYGAAEAICGK